MRHRFHALCPYFAMFPEAFVEEWINRLTRVGDVVLDPFCGRGTTPFQALLMGRNAVAFDISPVAYCITQAKTNAPSPRAVRSRITVLENCFNQWDWENERRRLPEFFGVAYSRSTLRQLLYLRSALRWQASDTDCMIAALVLGALHGESEHSSSYLSNQMPHAISTKPAYSVRYWQKHGLVAPHRDTFQLLRNRVAFRYVSTPPERRATVFNADMRRMIEFGSLADKPLRCAITSPPYLDITNFEEDQWLRNWFLGGPPEPTRGRISKDDRHLTGNAYWGGLIADMWRTLGAVLSRRANVVIRYGAKGILPEQMADLVTGSAAFSNRKVDLVKFEISQIRRRQTDTFRPGATGCRVEVDCHFLVA